MRRKLSESEIGKIKEALNIILDDLEEIWNLGLTDEIIIPVTLEGIAEFDPLYPPIGWNFVMDNKGIYMKNDYSPIFKFYFGIKNSDGELERCYSNIDERELMFLREYDEIRKKIMEQIEKIQEEKDKNIELVEYIKRKYNKEAEIQITLPNSINQRELRVSQENGRTIGILDFGATTIKLITDGSIKLVSEETIKSDKVKVK